MNTNDQQIKGTGGNSYNGNKSRRDSSGIIFDKLPPQAIDMEEVLLGCMMLDNAALASVIDMLKPECFYVEKHQYLFEAIRNLFSKSQPVDIMTITSELIKNGKLDDAGGTYYIAKLLMYIGTTAHVEEYARIVLEKYIARELIQSANEIIKDAFNPINDIFEVLDKAENKLFGIAENNLRGSYQGMSNLVPAALKQLETIAKQEKGVIGVPSGFMSLDRLTSGWQRSDLIILAARPAMGKTAFVLSLARNAAIDFKKPIAIFSLEMSSLQLTNRLLSQETGIPLQIFKCADLTSQQWLEITDKSTRIASAPIFIDDTAAINIFELRAKCRRLKMQHDIQMIVIDYLQLMSGTSSDKKGGNREQEISLISRSLKSIAKELDVPVIALSQLSREVEKRGGDKRPQLSDLRESGAIEQDADIVMFLYRPEYYGFDTDETGNPTQGVTEVIIAKHRNGPLATAKVKFVAGNAQFVDCDEFAGDFDIKRGIRLKGDINHEDTVTGFDDEAPF